MAYTINKTDGSILTEIIDGTINQISTDLTLLGKNVSNYGEVFNENFVHLLENFANSSAPNYPITGQVWYDTSEGRLKVYDGAGFRTSGGPIVSGTTPASLIQGDLWINNLTNQLYFYDGTDLLLAGPLYTNEQGLSGPEVVSVLDNSGNLKVIVKLWVGQQLIGIWSKEAFTPAVAIDGITGIIYKGFNSSTLADAKYHGTATKADALVSPLGTLKTTSAFVSTEASGGNTTMAAGLKIQNATPLILGTGENYEIRVTDSLVQFVSNNAGQAVKIRVKGSGGITTDAVSIDAVNSRVGIFTTTPTATLDVTGTAKVSGNLTVSGNVLPAWQTKIYSSFTAGAFVPGNSYVILTSGSTNFLAIGSSSNSVGTLFTATGPGTGNGTAVLAHVLSAGDRIMADTTLGPYSVVLPASPSVGDYVRFVDASQTGFDTNNLTIKRNGNKINNATSDLVVGTEGAAFTLVYTGSNRGWVYDYVQV